VARDGRWGRAYESWSEDPEIVATYAAAMVEGIQGRAGSDEFLAPHKLIATVKHFLADGGTDGGKDQGDSLASEDELRDVHAAGYVAGIEAGVQTVMASFSSWQGTKMHGHGGLLTGVLKGRFGFDGILVGDWNAHGQVPGCTNASCATALQAGIDLFMVPEDWKALYQATLEQARSGEVTAERLDDAVSRMLRVKLRAALPERGRPSSRPLAGKRELLGAPEHRSLAREAVRQSLVLLKNNGALLPLRANQRVLVAGDGADDVAKQSGGWTITWQGTETTRADFPGATSIWEGISAAVQAGGGAATLSVDGSFPEGARPDVAIVVWGENPYAEFQGDVPTLEHQPGAKRDLELLRRLRESGIPVVSVLLSGRPLWVNPELNASDAFVAAWLPGSEGAGVADLLFRAPDGSVAHDFTGKLSFSWPKRPDQAVLHRGMADYDPLFPFGHGLTYADRGDLAALSEEGAAPAAAGGASAFFAGDPVAPWGLYVGDAANWKIAASGMVETTGPSPLRLQPVDRERQGDARAARFAGGAPAQVYLQADTPVDLSRESNGEMALAFDVMLEEAPSDQVTLRMDCGFPCSGALDVTERLRALPPGEWTTLRFRLRCFADAGADMTRIDTPFLLATSGNLSLRLADVELVSAAAGEAACP
jgi:beta-glucosidase